MSWMNAFSAFTRFYHSKSAPPVSSNTTRFNNAAVDKLTQAAHKLAASMYAQAPPAGDGAQPDKGTPGASDEKKKDDDVIDAEFVDVDEGKK